MRKVTSCVTFPVLILICVIIMQTYGQPEKKCGSIDVRNNMSAFEKLSGCTVVEGFVQIVLLEKTTENDFLNVTFTELREITQYLLVYRVRGLKSLGHLFPNLAVIRGTSLFINAALAIYENWKLQDIGLRSLTHIMEGNVIIHKNYNLCFANTIDWDAIMKTNNSTQTYYEAIVKQNKESRECSAQEVCKECERNLCWSKNHCQRLKLEGCHPLCAGGCYENNSANHCFVCRGVLTTEGRCVASCPPDSYEYLKRLCVTKEQCHNTPVRSNKEKIENYNFFTFNGSCISECPSKYRKNAANDSCISCSEIKCYKKCTPDSHSKGVFRLTTVSDSKSLQSCTYIDGSLVIESFIGNLNSGIESALENDLGMIEEITGRLKIIHSHALTSLNFLRNLKVIRGEQIDGSKNGSTPEDRIQHVLTVKDNKNLQQLWDWEKKPGGANFRIMGGKIFFHFNPKLCLSEIDKLLQVTKLTINDSLEVSKESNGYQSNCNAIPLNVTIEKIASNSVILALHVASSKNSSSDVNLGRFMVFYKESNGESAVNQSIQFDSISECGDTQWKMINYAASNNSDGTVHMLLPHLEPAVQYEYFVKSFTMSSSMGISPLQNVKTNPARSSVPLDFKVSNVTDSEMVLSWKPPSHPHGQIISYIIHGYWQTDKLNDVEKRDYCKYQLQKNEILTTKPILSTTTMAPVADGNCKCGNETEKDNFEYCNSFEHLTDMDTSKFENGLETCDAYIYGTLNANFLKLSSYHEQPLEESENKSVLKTNKSSSEENRISFSNKTGTDGKSDTFQRIVDSHTHFVMISNLRHFSEYIVLISACQEKHEELDNPCSRDTILSVRTEKNPSADAIDSTKIKVITNNQTTNISWEEPGLVNSFIHSYIIEYRSQDVENSKFSENCITAQEFKRTNGTYKIENLQAGHYVLKIKAISLAGEGSAAITEFYIEEQSKNYMSIILTSAVVVFVIIFIMSGSLYYWRLQIRKNRVLFATVNPRYEPVYVEDQWEVPRENLTLIKQLGRGTFGSVHEGILQPDGIRCAVKTVTAISEEDNMVFLKEATLMKSFHNAYHIVKLIGVVSKGSPVYVIMELMGLGDLKSFLLRHGGEYSDDNKTLPGNMLLKMAAEIADGMAFLEAKKFVHRDLAARNCMVSDQKTIKIGDFGLARDIYETDYYRKGDKGTLPIRWMAPESIRDGIFTSNSDVWSYGVVLWEITTLALMPYHPRTNEEVIKYVKSGQVLDIPTNAHEVLKPLMKYCWRWHASHRPKFVQILKLLDSYMDHEFRKVSFFHNGENPNDPDNVIPCRTTTEECYIYNDENNEINLYLGQSPGTSGLTPSAKFQRYIPYRANDYIENLR